MEIKNIYDEFIDWFVENESAYLFLSRSGDIRCKSEREDDELHIEELFIGSFATGVYEFGLRFPVVKECNEYRKRLFGRLFDVFSAHSVAVRDKRPELRMRLSLMGFEV
jgi:hypothetical protein